MVSSLWTNFYKFVSKTRVSAGPSPPLQTSPSETTPASSASSTSPTNIRTSKILITLTLVKEAHFQIETFPSSAQQKTENLETSKKGIFHNQSELSQRFLMTYQSINVIEGLNITESIPLVRVNWEWTFNEFCLSLSVFSSSTGLEFQPNCDIRYIYVVFQQILVKIALTL